MSVRSGWQIQAAAGYLGLTSSNALRSTSHACYFSIAV
jgi:hypothetical protein